MAGAVLWDLDGTLVESEQLHWLAWRHTMDAEGVSISREVFESTFGQRNDAILPIWIPGATPDTIQRIGDAKEEHYRRLVRDHGLTPLPGAAEWVAKLHARGWRQAIASSAPRLNVEVMLAALGFGNSMDAFVTAEDVQHGKPDPEVFLKAAARLDMPPRRSIVVEDAAAGIEAARRAGMRTIDVGRSVKTIAADITVASLTDLPDHAFELLLAPARR